MKFGNSQIARFEYRFSKSRSKQQESDHFDPVKPSSITYFTPEIKEDFPNTRITYIR